MRRLSFYFLTGLAIQLGHSPDAVLGRSFPCNLLIKDGRPTNDSTLTCEGEFMCNPYVGGALVHEMRCQPSSLFGEGSLSCNVLCPDKIRRHDNFCQKSGWFLSLERWCKPATTTSVVLFTSTPPGDHVTEEPGFSAMTILWTAILCVALVLIMACVCSFAIKASRSRRRGLQTRTPGRSPTMIYSVTLSGDQGNVLRDSINNYLRQSSQPSPDVTKPPSYEEVTRNDQNAEKPPPYSEVV